MITLDLKQAADWLHLHPESLRRQVVRGDIPAAKTGKSWIFLEDDLVKYVRSQYRKPLQLPQGREKLCKSSSVASIGGIASQPQTDKDYSDLLGLPVNG